MAHSNETTVEGYISSLPEDKAEVISKLRKMILEVIPDGIEENMNWGMISYEVPLGIYPNTYNDKPLSYAALASQKNHFSIYSTNLYMNEKYMPSLIEAYKKIGSKPNMGKSCIRFTKIENIPIDEILRIIGDSSLDEFIKGYEKIRQNR